MSGGGKRWAGITVLQRFEQKYIPEPNSGCWLWTAAVAGQRGYGKFWNEKHELEYAHRFSWRLHRGEITEEQIDHKCSNPRCVNPDHLEPVSFVENLRRTRERGRGYQLKPTHGHETHCPRGHPYSGENLIVRGGHRECRECVNFLQRERTRRRKVVV